MCITLGELAMIALVLGLPTVAWLLDSGYFPVIGPRVRSWLHR